MDQQALLAGLRMIRRGLDDVIGALESEPERESERTKRDREVALLLEFAQDPGNGLTREEASRACRKHEFDPRTVGAWATAGYIATEQDGRRYLTPAGRERAARVA